MTYELAQRNLTYAPVGSTWPDSESWKPPSGLRAFERTVRVGDGEAFWLAAGDALLDWGVKTRSGFTVEPVSGASSTVVQGADYWLVASIGPITVREPVRIVAVVDEPDRRGFAYGTLTGHPVSGEEAFILHRTVDGAVWLTLRSLTQASRGHWRPVFPLLLVAQRWYRRRYLQALPGLA